MTLTNKNVLITGASSGIGNALARCFAENGYNLVIVSRDQSEIEQVAQDIKTKCQVSVTPLSIDLFNPESAKNLYNQIKEKNIKIDILVNNAGQGEWGKFWETDLSRQLDIIQLNVISLVSLTHLYLKEMVARNEGKILNVASIAGTMPNPLTAIYGATKAFVLSFSEALYNELRDTNVTITALLPGPTETEWFDKANARDTKVGQDEKATPESVAKVAFEALMKGEEKVIEGFKNNVQVMAGNVLPDQVSAEQHRKMMTKTK
jgi:short-subunit dehydrogenase